MIKFEVLGTPQGKARARTYYDVNKEQYASITPEKTALYEEEIRLACIEAMSKKRHKPYVNKEPLSVWIVAYYPIPKSASVKKKEAMISGGIYPVVKPDVDNVTKAVLDAVCNGIAAKDDTQVCDLHITKFYTEDTPKIIVEIMPLPSKKFHMKFLRAAKDLFADAFIAFSSK